MDDFPTKKPPFTWDFPASHGWVAGKSIPWVKNLGRGECLDDDLLEPSGGLQLVLLAYPPADGAEDKKLFTACEQDQPEEKWGKIFLRLWMLHKIISIKFISTTRAITKCVEFYFQDVVSILRDQVKCMGHLSKIYSTFIFIFWYLMIIPPCKVNLNGFHINTKLVNLAAMEIWHHEKWGSRQCNWADLVERNRFFVARNCSFSCRTTVLYFILIFTDTKFCGGHHLLLKAGIHDLACP